MAKKTKSSTNNAPTSASTIPQVSHAPATSKPTTKKTTSISSLIFRFETQRAVWLAVLAATYSPLSQLILSPVFGSIPSAVYHKYLVLGSSLLSFALRGSLPTWVELILPAFAFWIPTIHFVFFKFSTAIGNPLGPLVIELSTLFPLITLSMYMSSRLFDDLDLSFLGETFAEAGPSMFSYLVFTLVERIMKNVLPQWMGGNAIFSRVGWQLLIATTYGLLLPASTFWPALPSAAFSMVANVHVPLTRTNEVLNNTLALQGYTLLERRDSLTGYLSVLEDNNNHFRVMRCDHSLLGGEWIIAPDGSTNRQIAEPVYAVFTMLESVRLVERQPSESDDQERALTIGLGVGTAPSAFIAHGIATTIIELDPVVHDFATRYFGLPKNHTAYIADAVGFANHMLTNDQERWQGRFDYIVHDVFTGGAEPVQLFTLEFLTNLHRMLKPNGVIAVNYAGDLATPSPSIIYRTVNYVFPSCRVFREDEQIAEDGTEAVGTKDDSGQFTNMVFICTKSKSPVKFRKASEADFLGSASRKAYMIPKHEMPPERFQRNGNVLTKANTRELEKLHVQSAIGHWKLMRKVIPDAVWENW